jgi:trk system potassium uptake protein TrkH
MNYKNILKILSLIGITVSLVFLLDILVGLVYKEHYDKFLLYDLMLFLLNLSIFIWLKDHDLNLKIKESILVVNLLWVLLGVVGALPLYIYTNISFASSFFEAVSGFTTTGATIYSDIESLPHMILFHRSLMHWLGGMGVIVLGVGLLSVINPTGSLSLFKAEATGIQLEKLTPKIKDTALRLWGIYFALTLADALLLKFFGMGWFDAINHAFSTISTGGFSTKNSSLGGFENDGIIWVTTFFMLISGINFLAHLRFLHKDFSGYKSEEAKWLVSLFLLLSILLSFIHFTISDDSFYESAKHSFFTISSIATTTGFATVDYETWGHLCVAIIFLSMLLGGNTGSTAGGVKTIRYIFFFKNIKMEIKKILHPNAIVSVFIDNKMIKNSLTASVFGFFALYIITSVTVMLYLYARGLDEMSAISTALATVGNIGPGFSLTGPAQNYGFFEWYDKIILSFAMIIGRLECYTVYLLFVRDFWRKF